MSDEDKARTLFGHIDDHLKALALFSLPSLDADPTSDEQKSSSGAQPPTSVGSKADSTASSQGLAQVDADLEGSLTFDDDPHSLIEAIGDEATVNKERVSDVPSSLDATLEWKFVSSEQGAPELDPVLEDLRRGHEPSPHVTISLSQEITLKEQILSTSVESVFDYGRKHFYPNGITDSLITKESITRELQAESPSQAQSHEEVEGLVEFISVSAKKLFAITMLTEPSGHLLQQSMETFRDKGDAGPPYYVAVEKSHKYHWTVAASSAWKDRVELLSRMNSLNHRHIVRFVAAFQRGLHDRCTMFEWASGGNLTHLWNTFNRPKLVPGFVKAAFRQLVGLTSAMNLVHDASLSHHSFHGDLMPENILWFNNDNYSELGTLKIGGWAFGEELERKHTSPGVQRFEAPEFSNDPRSSSTRSPLSDIWSMGCIMLEFLIWLMYGVDGLDKFNVASRCTTFFGKTKDENQNGRLVTTVHPVVLEWMDHMAADPACEVRATALGNLLELIRVRLLVVEVPQRPRLARSTTYFQLPSRHPYSVAGPSRQGSERSRISSKP
ncbi:hypothetical protein N0V84_007482 [Fusarium piperis]|uniref:Protein kinase domain-containing protein n=1 Tax=Fusarium piperis TaxID=1435070 RepID=A0A9W9BLJ6_9HYPO|nr:hypothetical protein N0V84_007482 [Fusarium piperis]